MKKTCLLILILLVNTLMADYVERAYFTGRYPDQIIIYDANHDGNLEIYNPIYINDPDTQNVFVREYNGYQPISFTKLPFYGIPWDIGDIDQDGLIDMVVQSGDPGMGGNGYLRIYEQTYPCGYPDNLIAQVVLPDRKVVYYAKYTDLDQDGKNEVLMSPNSFSGGGVRIYEWSNNQLNLVWEYVGGEVSGKTVADFDGDNKLEFVFTEMDGAKNNLPQQGSPTFSIPTREKTLNPAPMQVKVFECTGDNSYDQVWLYQYLHSLCNIGPTFNLDFEGDHRLEFLACFSTWDVGFRYLIFRYENGTYQLIYDLGDSTGFGGRITSCVADFDRDDKDEFVGLIQPWWIRIYNWTENGVVYDSIYHEDLGIYSADFDHDQWPDIYAVLWIGSTPDDDIKFYEYEEARIAEQIVSSMKQDFKVTPTIGKNFLINSTSNQELTLYDIRGVRLNTLKPGRYNLSYLPNGIYFIRSERTGQSQRVVILK